MSKKNTSGLIMFLLNYEEETEEDAREYLKKTGADPEEMIRKVMEVLEGRGKEVESLELRVKSEKLQKRGKEVESLELRVKSEKLQKRGKEVES